jgi:DNA helicase-2/ATP-dependent DNA helicase PcrA
MLFGATQYNRISRFAEEIPEDCVERLPKKVPLNEHMPSKMGSPHESRFTHAELSANKPKSVPMPDFKPGDEVEHKTFGRGFILSAQQMGGDMLLEVSFDRNGTRRLMAKVASSAMKKI